MEIKNWKEYPKVQEVKEKFENEKSAVPCAGYFRSW